MPLEEGVEFIDEAIDVDFSEGELFVCFLELLQVVSWLLLSKLLGVISRPASPASDSL